MHLKDDKEFEKGNRNISRRAERYEGECSFERSAHSYVEQKRGWDLLKNFRLVNNLVVCV